MRKFQPELPRGTIRYMLEALIPYSRANLKLSFKPNAFFNDLEKIAGVKYRTAQNTYYKSIKDGLVVIDRDSLPRLTEQAVQLLKPFQPQKLKDSSLMVIFDIPESDRWKRQELRLLLRELRFTQIQKSVWQSSFDSRKYLIKTIHDLKLQGIVLVYEARLLDQ